MFTASLVLSYSLCSWCLVVVIVPRWATVWRANGVEASLGRCAVGACCRSKPTGEQCLNNTRSREAHVAADGAL
jgi:hypothetical protein